MPKWSLPLNSESPAEWEPWPTLYTNSLVTISALLVACVIICTTSSESVASVNTTDEPLVAV